MCVFENLFSYYRTIFSALFQKGYCLVVDKNNARYISHTWLFYIFVDA